MGSFPTKSRFDSGYWSYNNVYTAAYIFAIYLPVYAYAIMAFYLIILVDIAFSPRRSPSLQHFHQTYRGSAYAAIYIVTLASLLGTPPTLGFFGKLMSFYVLSPSCGLELYSAIAATLVLIVFYLQTVRGRAVGHRRTSFTTSPTSYGRDYVLVLGQVVLLGFAFIMPHLLDSFYAMTL